jgi:trans-aconitate methyltransferase
VTSPENRSSFGPAAADNATVESFLRRNDPPSYFALRTLNGLKGSRVERHRLDILRFLIHRYGEIPWSRYLRRLHRLRELQAIFDKTNAYEATSYNDVTIVDRDDYNVALLLSFISTNHRFEILETLQQFVQLDAEREPRELLSIGFGTGYELKLVCDTLPTWQYEAYDTSFESFEYASQLLAFFGYSQANLKTSAFPLETDDLPMEYRGRYAKIVLCELLEHLENPEAALRNMRLALHDEGVMFTTMAINIAQEDHIYLYRTKDEARQQVERAGLTIIRELVTPVTIVPFAERDRERVFKRGNYICWAKRS